MTRVAGRLRCARDRTVSPNRCTTRIPRWSPDAKWIAYQRGDGVRWDVFAVPAGGGPPRQLTRENRQIHGLAWLPDSTRHRLQLEPRHDACRICPTLSLWEVRLDGGEPRLRRSSPTSRTCTPTSTTTARWSPAVCRCSSICGGIRPTAAATDNVQRAVRITRQTGTGADADGGRRAIARSRSSRTAAVMRTSGSLTPATGALRQITHERDRASRWACRSGRPMASGLRLSRHAATPAWGSACGLRESRRRQPAESRRARPRRSRGLPTPGGSITPTPACSTRCRPPAERRSRVRPGPARNVVGFDGKTLYFIVDRTLTDGSPGFEIHAATPEDAPSRVLARIPASRAPQWQIVNPVALAGRQRRSRCR